jgi:hypothetical protein
MLLIKRVKGCFGVKAKRAQISCVNEVEAQADINKKSKTKKSETKKGPKTHFLFPNMYLSSLKTDTQLASNS